MSHENKSASNAIPTALALLLALFATHPQSLSSLTHLPNITVALMFLGGMHLKNARWWALFFLCTVLIDNLSVRYAGVSNHCITLAYLFMLPTYAMPWIFGARYAAQSHSCHIIPLFAHMLAASTLAFFLSDVSFYFLSGYFVPNFAEYMQRFALYYPKYVAVPCTCILLYAGFALFANRWRVRRRHLIT
ncbi:MAG: hypothetical protein ACYYK0_05315 [Candidatus Eutrophobiaceae bacterium]